MTDEANEDVIEGEVCAGFQVSRDGARFRLQLIGKEGRVFALEFPISGLESLLKALPEVQQVALPRRRGNGSLRVVRYPEAWSLERGFDDDALVLILVTGEGYEWCFRLDDDEVFKMAEYLGRERMVTLPPSGLQQ